MRDKLVELIKRGGVIIPETAEAVADHLIANNVFVLPEKMKDNWELALPFMMRLFCADEEEIAKIKAEFELSQKKQILTDIRDYLVERQRCLAIESRMCPKIRETALVLSMIEDLQKYAEKLGVEL